tara:strand:+ start:1409 stop:2128 length:720 start_codon:yes stop_codon:yes gene_type:complete
MRNFNRKYNELRKINVIKNFNSFSDGSCLISFGQTKVLCSATIENGVPIWLRGQNKGWITAEYSMLPGSTNIRNQRESKIGKRSGRSIEIERLIGRSIRSITNLDKIPNIQIVLDCDVLQADGGTRTTSINGAFIALCLAIKTGIKKKIIAENPIKQKIAAIACGLIKEDFLLDLDFEEDQNTIADANFVLSEKKEVIEVQISGEKRPLSKNELKTMFDLAEIGIKQIIDLQTKIIHEL